jgi:hypothetical protein
MLEQGMLDTRNELGAKCSLVELLGLGHVARIASLQMNIRTLITAWPQVRLLDSL